MTSAQIESVEPIRGHLTLEAQYVTTASPRPASFAQQFAAVLVDVALAVGGLFALILVPVLAVRGIAVVASLLLDALRGSG